MKIEVSKPTQDQIKKMSAWPVWEHEAATFPYHYDEQETCLIIEGRVTVKAKDQTVNFGAGDLVIFPKGLDCEWTIHQAVRKYYRFG